MKQTVVRPRKLWAGVWWPSGVRRFYVRDPFRKTIDILSHTTRGGSPPASS